VLNQLAGRNSGFDIGSTVEPKTQGIWLWCIDNNSIHLEEYGLPKDYNLILIDTEGIGSYTKSETYDVEIFSLALLLSSYFVYNSLGSIDETALDRLSLVLELSKHIQAQTNQQGADPYQIKMFFPSFLWLVRDFSLELVIQGKLVSSREYLETALQPQRGQGERVAGKNQIRHAITEYFQDRDCFTMKRPVADEYQLQHLAELKMSELRPEFLEQIAALKKLIFQRAKPKSLYGQVLNGQMFVDLMRQYVNAINEGSVPTIHTAWESVAAQQCQRALEIAKKHYTEKISSLFENGGIVEDEELLACHNDSRNNAVMLIRKHGVVESLPMYEEQLANHITETFNKYRSENAKRSLSHCERLISGLLKPISDFVSTGECDKMDTLEAQWMQALERYHAAAAGPARLPCLASTMKLKLFEHTRRVAQAMLEKEKRAGEQRLQEAMERSTKEYKRLEVLYTDIEGEWKRAQQLNRDLSAEKRDLQDKLMQTERVGRDHLENIERLEKKLQQAKEKNEKLDSDLKKLESVVNELTGKANQATQQIEILTKDKSEIEAELQQAKRNKCSVM
jgi:hypothetical protein